MTAPTTPPDDPVVDEVTGIQTDITAYQSGVTARIATLDAELAVLTITPAAQAALDALKAFAVSLTVPV
jgi:hypothetical protein